jgi:hypothetical protein
MYKCAKLSILPLLQFVDWELELFRKCGILELFRQCGILELFRQCGILELFRQCGILELFRQCGILELFRQCGILDRQHNGQKIKYKRTNIDLQNIHIRLKIE